MRKRDGWRSLPVSMLPEKQSFPDLPRPAQGRADAQVMIRGREYTAVSVRNAGPVPGSRLAGMIIAFSKKMLS